MQLQAQNTPVHVQNMCVLEPSNHLEHIHIPAECEQNDELGPLYITSASNIHTRPRSTHTQSSNYVTGLSITPRPSTPLNSPKNPIYETCFQSKNAPPFNETIWTIHSFHYEPSSGQLR